MREAQNLDVYAMQDYEVVIPSLVDELNSDGDLSSVRGIAYRNGDKVVINELAVPLKDYNSLPMPAYDLLPSLDVIL